MKAARACGHARTRHRAALPGHAWCALPVAAMAAGDYLDAAGD